METLTLREAVHLVKITHLVCSTPGVGTHGFFFFSPHCTTPCSAHSPQVRSWAMVRGCSYPGVGPL